MNQEKTFEEKIKAQIIEIPKTEWKRFCNHPNKEVCKPSWCGDSKICYKHVSIVNFDVVLKAQAESQKEEKQKLHKAIELLFGATNWDRLEKYLKEN